MGLLVGYVQKQWTFTSGEGSWKYGYWDDSKFLNGLQAGIRVEPLFNYGFGIDTGLYYEFYYSQSKPMLSDDGSTRFRPSYEEHALYLPLRLEYRLNFSDNFQLFFYGGLGLDYTISAKIKTNSEDVYYEEDDAYDSAVWKKFNASLEYGGGLRIHGVQLNFTMSNGLVKMEDEADGVFKLSKPLAVSVSYMF